MRTTVTTTTTADFSTPEAMAQGMLKLIKKAVLIKGEIKTLKGMLTAAEARSAQLDQAVIDLGLTSYVNRYQAHIKKLNG